LIAVLVNRLRRSPEKLDNHIELKWGDIPWKPSGGSFEHVYFSHHGMPLAGLIHQFGTWYYFWCIDGEVSLATLWGYVELPRGDIDSVKQTPSGLLRDFLLSESRLLTVALSIDGQGITRSDTIKIEEGRDVAEQVEANFPLTPEETLALESV
jgi:hypothetical protein